MRLSVSRIAGEPSSTVTTRVPVIATNRPGMNHGPRLPSYPHV